MAAEYAGAPFDWVFPQTFQPQSNWYIDGQGVPIATAEVSTDRTLSLTWRVESEILNSVLRPLKSDQGKVKVLDTDDGGFVAVDRANGGNTFALEPPDRRQPLRQPGNFHVESYEEELVSQTVDEWNVEIEFVRATNRTDSPTIDEAYAGAQFDWTFPQAFTRTFDSGWAFDTRLGQIVTDGVDAEFVGRGEGGVRRFELTTRLRFDEAHVFEAALNRLGGARIRDIPDATNVAVDDTDDDAATLGVTSPVSDTIVVDGDYVVQEWQSRRLNDGFQEAEFVIAEA